MRTVLIVLDGCGCGAAEDAATFGDVGSNTLAHTARAVGGLTLPTLGQLGLGNIVTLQGVPPVDTPSANWGRMRELSAGKDTTSGHWELAGLVTGKPFATYPQGFDATLIQAFVAQTGRDVLGNKVASGTAIIEELGHEHMHCGKWIVYTSADSVFQVAAHEDIIPIDELYTACRTARSLCDPYNIGRVIARPFLGTPGHFKRTYRRKDFSMPPHGETILSTLQTAGVATIGVGKISDIFSGVGVSQSVPTQGNADGMRQTIAQLDALSQGFIFVNLIDFDALYGHRRDPRGFADALEAFDAWLPQLLARLRPDDLLLITADHGNDPTFKGTDHTREHVPLLVYRRGAQLGRTFGTRNGFCDVAATVAEGFSVTSPSGHSLLPSLSGSLNAADNPER